MVLVHFSCQPGIAHGNHIWSYFPYKHSCLSQFTWRRNNPVCTYQDKARCIPSVHSEWRLGRSVLWHSIDGSTLGIMCDLGDRETSGWGSYKNTEKNKFILLTSLKMEESKGINMAELVARVCHILCNHFWGTCHKTCILRSLSLSYQKKDWALPILVLVWHQVYTGSRQATSRNHWKLHLWQSR